MEHTFSMLQEESSFLHKGLKVPHLLAEHIKFVGFTQISVAKDIISPKRNSCNVIWIFTCTRKAGSQHFLEQRFSNFNMDNYYLRNLMKLQILSQSFGVLWLLLFLMRFQVILMLLVSELHFARRVVEHSEMEQSIL